MISKLLDTKNYKLILLGMVVSSFVLQMVTIGKWSFWFDESFTSQLLKFNYTEIPYRTGLDVHPPLYYWVLKAWSGLFGTNDFGLRSFSLLMSLASILLSFDLARRLFDKRAGLAAAFFVGVGPYVIRYGQEARMYAFVSVLLLTMSIIFVIQSKKQPDDRSIKIWLLYGILLAMCLYSHYFSVLILPTHGLYWLISRSHTQSVFSRIDYKWLGAVLFGFILYIPWLPTLYDQFTNVNGGFWIAEVGTWTFPDTLVQLVNFRSMPQGIGLQQMIYWAGIGGLFVSLVWLISRMKSKSNLGLLILFGPLVIGAILLFIVSVLPGTSSLYTNRYLAQFAPLFYAGLGVAVYKLVANKRNLGLLIAFGLMISFGHGITKVYTGDGGAFGDNRPNGRALMAISKLEDMSIYNPVVVTSGFWNYYDWDHYLDRVFLHDDNEIDSAGAVLLRGRGEEVYLINFTNDLDNGAKLNFLYVHNPDDNAKIPANWTKKSEIFREKSLIVEEYTLSQ